MAPDHRHSQSPQAPPPHARDRLNARGRAGQPEHLDKVDWVPPASQDLRDSVPGRPRPPLKNENSTWESAALPRALRCPRRGLTPRRPATDVEPLCSIFPRRAVELQASHHAKREPACSRRQAAASAGARSAAVARPSLARSLPSVRRGQSPSGHRLSLHPVAAGRAEGDPRGPVHQRPAVNVVRIRVKPSMSPSQVGENQDRHGIAGAILKLIGGRWTIKAWDLKP